MLTQVRHWPRCRASNRRLLHPRYCWSRPCCSSHPLPSCHPRIWFHRSRENLPLPPCHPCYSSLLRPSPLKSCRPRTGFHRSRQNLRLPPCRPCCSSPLRRSPLQSSRHRRWCLLNSKRRHPRRHRSPSHSSSNRRLARSDPARSPNRRKQGRPMRTNLRSSRATCASRYRMSWKRGRWPVRHPPVDYGIAFDPPGIASQALTCASLTVPEKSKSVAARRRMAICWVGAWKITRKIAVSLTGRDHLPTPP